MSSPEVKKAGERSTRRNFLTNLIIGWGAILCLPSIYAIVQYIIPPVIRERLIESLKVGKVTDIPVDGSKLVKFNKTPVIFLKNSDGQIRAFSAVCTHLGCTVEFRSEDKKFHCNCHGSIFDANGKNIGGPAPRPLQPYRVEIRQDDIYVSNS